MVEGETLGLRRWRQETVTEGDWADVLEELLAKVLQAQQAAGRSARGRVGFYL